MAEVYLKCQWKDREVYLPGRDVAGISSRPQITPCPSASETLFYGLTQYEGEAVPVFDCQLALVETEGEEVPGPETVVFLELPEARVGVGVSDVMDFVRVDEEQVSSELRVTLDEFEASLVEFMDSLSQTPLNRT